MFDSWQTQLCFGKSSPKCQWLKTAKVLSFSCPSPSRHSWGLFGPSGTQAAGPQTSQHIFLRSAQQEKETQLIHYWTELKREDEGREVGEQPELLSGGGGGSHIPAYHPLLHLCYCRLFKITKAFYSIYVNTRDAWCRCDTQNWVTKCRGSGWQSEQTQNLVSVCPLGTFCKRLRSVLWSHRAPPRGGSGNINVSVQEKVFVALKWLLKGECCCIIVLNLSYAVY